MFYLDDYDYEYLCLLFAERYVVPCFYVFLVVLFYQRKYIGLNKFELDSGTVHLKFNLDKFEELRFDNLR